MRALLALLLLANLGFFALARGWLEPYVGLTTQHEREPQRLSAQLNADSVRVLDAKTVGTAEAFAQSASMASMCLQAGPFNAEQIEAAEAALAPAQWPGLVARRVDNVSPGEAPYWLRVGAADAAQRERLLSLAPQVAGIGFVPCPRVP